MGERLTGIAAAHGCPHPNRRAVTNELSGAAAGPVVQAGTVSGGIHVHQLPRERETPWQVADSLVPTGSRCFAQASGDPGILLPTSEYDRIDVGYTTPNLTPAVTGYWALSTPAKASDHHGFAFRLDTTRAAPTGDLFTWR